MVESELIPDSVRAELTEADHAYLAEVFARFGGVPTLPQLWQLMDEQWTALGCDPKVMDGRISRFYDHPVWLLNGLFVEWDKESRRNRVRITDWVLSKNPQRIADFGGGFGGLARMISTRQPALTIEVVDPHPHQAALALARDVGGVRYVPELTGQYDIILATDVFEHVPDPLDLFVQTAKTLRRDGLYFTANCFAPVIKCHLPQSFHLRYGWDHALAAMGMRPEEKVCYGRAFRRVSQDFDLCTARKIAGRARFVRPMVCWLPRGADRVGNTLMALACGGRAV